MKKLARLALPYGSSYPLAQFDRGHMIACARFCLLLFVFVVCLAAVAFAQPAANAPIGDATTGGLISLWGPFLGVITALVGFFNVLARVIPNGTTSAILNGIRIVATILGAKVPDRQ